MTDASNPVEPKPQSRPLDASLYSIDDQALQFMREQTGIQDPEELKKHIFAAQAEAYAIHPYNCIRKFAFVQLKLGRLPAYEQLLALGKNRKDAIFLDIGCCFGNDIRKAVHDAFNPVHLDPVPPFYAPPDTPRPQLSTLTSLNPLRGHVSAIHASAFFHLFDEKPQFYLARALGGLLSPEPGSMILGVHGGRQEKGFRTEVGTHSTHRKTPMFCHSPESWTELWDGQVFKKGTVKVEAFLHETPRKDLEGAPGVVPGAKFYILVWSVTRL